MQLHWMALVAALGATARCAADARADYLAQFHLRPAPAKPAASLLKLGDRLAICGDSITEQRMYSRIIETYLTACTPELDVSVRQYGWSGETAAEFLGRMTNDALRFQPTVATTCYGMNDHRYVPYRDDIGQAYRETMGAVVKAFQDHGVKVVLGSPGCVGKMPAWVKSATGTVLDLNLNLGRLRDIDLDLAAGLHTAGFGDVFGPMIAADHDARRWYGTNYCVPGKDGVHPGWAGQAVMAYAFLHGLGLDGDLGGVTVDLDHGTAAGRNGHVATGFDHGTVTVRSSRHPFCAGRGANEDDGALRSGLQWTPFQEELNRFTLTVKGAKKGFYNVTWGGTTLRFSVHQLREGVNLPAMFQTTPFDEAFAKVDAAVAAKQAFETRQIKELFHGDAGRRDMEGTVKQTEEQRAPLAAAAKAAVTEVVHTITITPAP
jgi:lysophospholipase L1-like esterase